MVPFKWLPKDQELFKNISSDLQYKVLRELYPKLFESYFFDTNNYEYIIKAFNLIKPIKVEEG